MARIAELNAIRDLWREKQRQKEAEERPQAQAKKRLDQFVNKMSNIQLGGKGVGRDMTSLKSSGSISSMLWSNNGPTTTSESTTRISSSRTHLSRTNLAVQHSNNKSNASFQPFTTVNQESGSRGSFGLVRPDTSNASFQSSRSASNASLRMMMQNHNSTSRPNVLSSMVSGAFGGSSNATAGKTKRYAEVDPYARNMALHESVQDLRVRDMSNLLGFPDDTSVQSSLSDGVDGRDYHNPAQDSSNGRSTQQDELSRLKRLLSEKEETRHHPGSGSFAYRPTGKKEESRKRLLHEQTKVGTCDITLGDQMQDHSLPDQVTKENNMEPSSRLRTHATVQTFDTKLEGQVQDPVPAGPGLRERGESSKNDEYVRVRAPAYKAALENILSQQSQLRQPSMPGCSMPMRVPTMATDHRDLSKETPMRQSSKEGKPVHKRATVETCDTTLVDESDAPVHALSSCTPINTTSQYHQHHKGASDVPHLTYDDDSVSEEFEDDGLLVGFVDRSERFGEDEHGDDLIVDFVDRSDRSSWYEDW